MSLQGQQRTAPGIMLEQQHRTLARLLLWSALPLLAACAGASTAPSVPAQLPPAAVGSLNPGPHFQGCPFFNGGAPYANGVRSAPLDPNSASYISSLIQAGDTSGFYASTGVEQINLANNQTPLLTVHPKSSHKFPVPYPWQPYFFIEPLSDHHSMVVQTDSCYLYEAYSTSYASGQLSAYSGANWALKKKYVPLAPGNPSAMASGLPMFAGMVTYDDYKSGSIPHALNWDGVAHTVSQYGFVWPASDTDRLSFDGSSSYQLPYGARLRLKASFSTSGWGPQATMVANAMKNFGVYLCDTGSSGNGIYFANGEDGSNPWNSSDLRSLGQITIGDFDVLQLPPIQKDH